MIIDFTKIFKKAAGCQEDKRNEIEKAVYTLKIEFTADCMISQDAANALDVMYAMAADHVSKKDLDAALSELAAIRDNDGNHGRGVRADLANDFIKIIERHVYRED